MRAEPTGMFDPALFGPDSRMDFEVPSPDEADEIIEPLDTRFARISLPMPVLHPLFDEHLRFEIAKRIGWTWLDVFEAATPQSANRLADALEAAGLGMLVMRELPMLPPELRPAFASGQKLDDDINDHYRRVIYRSNFLARVIATGAPEAVFQVQHRMLHEAIRMLFENDEIPVDDEEPDARVPVRDEQGYRRRSLRALCPIPPKRHLPTGTLSLWKSLCDLESYEPTRMVGTHEWSVRAPHRLRVARAVMFAMGFDLVPISA